MSSSDAHMLCTYIPLVSTCLRRSLTGLTYASSFDAPLGWVVICDQVYVLFIPVLFAFCIVLAYCCYIAHHSCMVC